MTDKEKMLGMLNGNNKLNSIEDILYTYLHIYQKDISILQLGEMMRTVNDLLGIKARELNRTKSIAKERARYLHSYLSGNMWLTEEAAKANIQPQIDNARAIMDACDGKWEDWS